ncbi:MAG: NADP-dependent oxidoreductase [Proteobacteria bacterium]|nr:NADP-dependent oxidoreductase [Pseudomonadota bacterium]
MEKNKQVLLASRPNGWVQTSDFKIIESQIPEPDEGEFVVKNNWLSLDPYMRGRMVDGKSYAKPVEIGEVMAGGTVGKVIKSKNPEFTEGQYVVGRLGWQSFSKSNGEGVSKIDPTLVPIQNYLGVCGMPGATAWIGLLEICQPKPGETVLVSAATGAVGSVVAQLAKISGCRVVGIAGGPDKCNYAKEEIGYDACVDYKANKLLENLKLACPDGVDCSFENVGGEIMDTVMHVLNPFSRIALCGLISGYNETEPYGMKMIRSILINRIKMQGFIVTDRSDLYQKALRNLVHWVSIGKIKYRETITEGIENAPSAFIGMLKGKNLGKQLVKIQ